MFSELRGALQELIEEPIGRLTLQRQVRRQSAGVEVLPESTLMLPPFWTIRHDRDVDIHRSA